MPHLRGCWEPHAHRRLVEPFCGGLAVAIGLRPARALLNDVNPHLINFYRWLKRGLTVTGNAKRTHLHSSGLRIRPFDMIGQDLSAHVRMHDNEMCMR